jgi:5-methylcytosine-specific restriction endonuclease McrA
MTDTLILNADGLPLSVVPLSTLAWQESIKLMFMERVDVMAYYDDWEVHSPSHTMRVPSVLMLHDYVNVNRNIKFSRANVLIRDDFTCQYCQVNFEDQQGVLTLDHVNPRFNGGKTNWENIVAACSPCNLRKAHFTTMKPTRMPQRPTYHQLMGKKMQNPIVVPHQSWADYLTWAPELITVKKGRRK